MTFKIFPDLSTLEDEEDVSYDAESLFTKFRLKKRYITL